MHLRICKVAYLKKNNFGQDKWGVNISGSNADAKNQISKNLNTTNKIFFATRVIQVWSDRGANYATFLWLCLKHLTNMIKLSLKRSHKFFLSKFKSRKNVRKSHELMNFETNFYPLSNFKSHGDYEILIGWH